MPNRHHRFKYPKLILLLTAVIIAVILFYEGKHYAPLHDFLVSIGYTGVFLSGLLYSSGFTAPPATAILLLTAREQDFTLSLLVGSLGALLGDTMIFLFVRSSFIDEIRAMQKEKIFRVLEKEEKKILGRFHKYLYPAIACILIASPLPTEIGVTMLAGIRRLSLKKFLLAAYVLHTAGILGILLIGNLV